MSPADGSTNPIRLLLVDDSAIIRNLMARLLRDSPDIDIAGLAANGEEALKLSRDLSPDIILLDLEMPVMDGLTAIPLLQQQSPNSKIILCSALSEKGADVTLRGLSLGASDFILKPSAITGDDGRAQFRDELLARIRTIARPHTIAPAREKKLQDYVLRADPPLRKPGIIAIGSSTGGPHALMEFFRLLKRPTIPVVITQHMPKTFTKILADQLSRCGDIQCVEGESGMPVTPGYAYVAPGDYHMTLQQHKMQAQIALNRDPPENFCRPAVDPMLRSLIPLYGDRILSLILTGMGSDGLAGCRDIIDSGGHVMAQDEESSAVWGMPGAVARAGLCTDVSPVPNLVRRVQLLMDAP